MKSILRFFPARRRLAPFCSLTLLAAAGFLPGALPVSVINQSTPTLCAEEDNVSLMLLSRNVTSYLLRAAHPGYEFTVDNTDPNFENCEFGSDPVFHFSDPGSVKLYDDGEWVVFGERFATFWMPVTMEVKAGAAVMGGCHTFTIHRKIQGVPSWPQIMVGYCDGNIRLKPHPREGFADNIFGSSALLGPVTSTGLRPVSVLESVEFVPAGGDVILKFADGSTTVLHVSVVNREELRLEVSMNRMGGALDLPFAALRSMFVEDGNSDVDTVFATHAGGGMSQEGVLAFGGAGDLVVARFGREHLSVHNTSAPDIEFSGFSGDEEPAVSAPSFAIGVVMVRQGRLWAAPLTPGTHAEAMLTGADLAPVNHPESPGHGLLYFDAPGPPNQTARVHRLRLPSPQMPELMTTDSSGSSFDRRPAVSPWHEWMIFETNRSGTAFDRKVQGHRMSLGVPSSLGGGFTARCWSRVKENGGHVYGVTFDERLLAIDGLGAVGPPVFEVSLAGRGTAGVTRLDHARNQADGHAWLLMSKPAGILLYDVEADTMTTLSTTGTEAVFDPGDPTWIAYAEVPAGESDSEVFIAKIGEDGLEQTRRLTFNSHDDKLPVWITVPQGLPEIKLSRQSPSSLRAAWPLWAAHGFLQTCDDLDSWEDEPFSTSNAVYEIQKSFHLPSLPDRLFFRLSAESSEN